MIATRQIVFNRFHKVILFIVFLLLVLLVMLPLLINPIAASLIKKQAAEIFEDKLTIGVVKVSFWTGTVIHLNGVELAQPPPYGTGSLLKAASVRVRVALAPLLNNQLVIQNVNILNPEIHLIQSRNGNLNTDYYLAKLTAKRNTPVKTREQEQSLQMQRFTVQNGKMIIDSYNFSKVQPTFELAACSLTLRNLELPNRDRLASPFSFTGLLGRSHQAKITVDGKGVFGAESLSFTAKSRVDNLFLPDYTFLAPQTAVTVTDGSASILSDSRCNNNYLKSEQHVVITNLKNNPKRGNLNGVLLGVPAKLFLKAIEDRKGTFDFDFSLTGQLDDLKANLKFKVIEAVNRAIRSKLGLVPITTGIRNGIRKVGNSLSQVFGKLFKKKK